MDQKDAEVQLRLEQKYQEDLLNFFGVIRLQRHDFNFHLNSLYGLIRRKDFEEAQNYIQEMFNKLSL